VADEADRANLAAVNQSKGVLKRKTVKGAECLVGEDAIYNLDMVMIARVSKTPEGKSKINWI
jgi:hypothetical protein